MKICSSTYILLHTIPSYWVSHSVTCPKGQGLPVTHPSGVVVMLDVENMEESSVINAIVPDIHRDWPLVMQSDMLVPDVHPGDVLLSHADGISQNVLDASESILEDGAMDCCLNCVLWPVVDTYGLPSTVLNTAVI